MIHADEKNPRSKESIRAKCEQYMKRAELLKEALDDKKKKKVAAPSGGGGGYVDCRDFVQNPSFHIENVLNVFCF